MKLDVKMVIDRDIYAPTYANETDACMDLKVKIEEGEYTLKPQEIKTFGTGLKVAVPENHVMLIFPRSSTGVKLNCMLTNTTGVIDFAYKNEIRMSLYNFGEEEIKLLDGQRIAQFMIIERPTINPIFVEDDEEFRKINRGGGIGSTNIDKKTGKTIL